MKIYAIPGEEIQHIVSDNISGPEGSILMSEERPSVNHICDSTGTWIINIDKLAEDARTTRDELLYKCDYTVLSDSPVDSAPWITYRQELRDVPQQPNFPESFTWPTEPT